MWRIRNSFIFNHFLIGNWILNPFKQTFHQQRACRTTHGDEHLGKIFLRNKSLQQRRFETKQINMSTGCEGIEKHGKPTEDHNIPSLTSMLNSNPIAQQLFNLLQYNRDTLSPPHGGQPPLHELDIQRERIWNTKTAQWNYCISILSNGCIIISTTSHDWYDALQITLCKAHLRHGHSHESWMESLMTHSGTLSNAFIRALSFHLFVTAHHEERRGHPVQPGKKLLSLSIRYSFGIHHHDGVGSAQMVMEQDDKKAAWIVPQCQLVMNDVSHNAVLNVSAHGWLKLLGKSTRELMRSMDTDALCAILIRHFSGEEKEKKAEHLLYYVNRHATLSDDDHPVMSDVMPLPSQLVRGIPAPKTLAEDLVRQTIGCRVVCIVDQIKGTSAHKAVFKAQLHMDDGRSNNIVMAMAIAPKKQIAEQFAWMGLLSVEYKRGFELARDRCNAHGVVWRSLEDESIQLYATDGGESPASKRDLNTLQGSFVGKDSPSLALDSFHPPPPRQKEEEGLHLLHDPLRKWSLLAAYRRAVRERLSDWMGMDDIIEVQNGGDGSIKPDGSEHHTKAVHLIAKGPSQKDDQIIISSSPSLSLEMGLFECYHLLFQSILCSDVDEVELNLNAVRKSAFKVLIEAISTGEGSTQEAHTVSILSLPNTDTSTHYEHPASSHASDAISSHTPCGNYRTRSRQRLMDKPFTNYAYAQNRVDAIQNCLNYALGVSVQIVIEPITTNMINVHTTKETTKAVQMVRDDMFKASQANPFVQDLNLVNSKTDDDEVVEVTTGKKLNTSLESTRTRPTDPPLLSRSPPRYQSFAVRIDPSIPSIIKPYGNVMVVSQPKPSARAALGNLLEQIESQTFWRLLQTEFTSSSDGFVLRSITIRNPHDKVVNIGYQYKTECFKLYHPTLTKTSKRLFKFFQEDARERRRIPLLGSDKDPVVWLTRYLLETFGCQIGFACRKLIPVVAGEDELSDTRRYERTEEDGDTYWEVHAVLLLSPSSSSSAVHLVHAPHVFEEDAVTNIRLAQLVQDVNKTVQTKQLNEERVKGGGSCSARVLSRFDTEQMNHRHHPQTIPLFSRAYNRHKSTALHRAALRVMVRHKIPFEPRPQPPLRTAEEEEEKMFKQLRNTLERKRFLSKRSDAQGKKDRTKTLGTTRVTRRDPAQNKPSHTPPMQMALDSVMRTQKPLLRLHLLSLSPATKRKKGHRSSPLLLHGSTTLAVMGKGYSVFVYSIPLGEVGEPLLEAEMQIGYGQHAHAEQASEIACYNAFRAHFPKEFKELVKQSPNVLNGVFGAVQ